MMMMMMMMMMIIMIMMMMMMIMVIDVREYTSIALRQNLNIASVTHPQLK